MRIRLNNVKLPIPYSDMDIKNRISHELRVKPSDIVSYSILRKSIDSRKKELKYVLNLAVSIVDIEKYLKKNSKIETIDDKEYTLSNIIKEVGCIKTSLRPVVVGTGPCGLFAALMLAKAGMRPIIIERGKKVEDRVKSVEIFNTMSILDTESNIQFGEGGAGTFSDGKLNTGINSDKIKTVLNEFVKYGANEDILYDAKPHIGTDILQVIVKNMREDIIKLGGDIRYSTKLINVLSKNGQLNGIVVESKNGIETINTNKCILAIGHSARDTFEMLSKQILMEQKAFSVGVRIEHLQENISKAQYGDMYSFLPPAPYNISCHLDNNRSCYSFCMCPGGYVVAAASEEKSIVTNGMSYNKRDGKNANSALLVGITPQDFNSDNVLAGVEFQRKYESLAYKISNSYKAPCQRVGDFKNKKQSYSYGEVIPTYPIGVEMADLRACLPEYVVDTIRQSLDIFGEKIKGFNNEDALLTGVETRSSSPIRMVRDKEGNSTIRGLFPAGEGAGYAGGITSAACDGINVAINVMTSL